MNGDRDDIAPLSSSEHDGIRTPSKPPAENGVDPSSEPPTRRIASSPPQPGQAPAADVKRPSIPVPPAVPRPVSASTPPPKRTSTPVGGAPIDPGSVARAAPTPASGQAVHPSTPPPAQPARASTPPPAQPARASTPPPAQPARASTPPAGQRFASTPPAGQPIAAASGPPRPRTSTIPGAASVPPPDGSVAAGVAPVVAPAPTDAGGAVIPGPAPLPYLPDAMPPAAPPDVPSAASDTPTIGVEAVPSAAGSSTDAAGRRRSRRTLKIPDDAVPTAATPQRATHPSSPPVDARPAPLPAPAADDDVIRPMRIISVEASAEPPPPIAAKPVAVKPAPPPQMVPPPPDSVEEIEPERDSSPSVGEDTISEAITQEREFEVPPDVRAEFEGRAHVAPAPEPASPVAAAVAAPADQPSRDSLEEIDPDAEAAPLSLDVPPDEDSSRAPKRPPPPPPKRTQTPVGVDAVGGPAPPTSAPAPAAAPAAQPAAAAQAAPAADAAALAEPRKRVKPWWEDLFGDDFIRTMDRLEAKTIKKEVDFIEESLGVEKGAVILDLACGTGQHAVELASRGYSVVGYDLSLAMLARAADEAQDRGQKLNFLQGDMREMAFDEMFDGVYCWSTSFGYFDDEKNLSVLSRVHRALRQGGMLLLEMTNRDFVAARSPSLVWFEGDGCVCMDEMHVDFFSSRLKVKRTAMFEDGRTRELDYSIRLYALHELGRMLHECGFKVVEVTGHPAHPGVFFGSESPRVIVLAERS